MKTINFLDSRTPKERKGELKPVTTFAQFSNMETIKDINKEFRKGCNTDNISDPPTDTEWIETFWLNKINEVIDDMMGEERSENTNDYDFGGSNHMDREHNLMRGMDNVYGYNQKVKELKDFKKKFNE